MAAQASWFAVFVSCFLGLGCEQLGELGENLEDQDGENHKGPPSDLLQGKWVKPCTVVSGLGVTETIHVSHNEIRVEEKRFRNQSCSGFEYLTLVATWTFANTEPLDTDLIAEAADADTEEDLYKIDMTLDLVEIGPNDDQITDQFIFDRLCGISNWTNHRGEDVTGKDCIGFFSEAQGYQQYDIFWVGEQTLRFGDRSGAMDGKSAEKRPTQTDKNRTFLKQPQ